MTFHYDAPNSHVADFNFLKFLVYVFLPASHSESEKYTCKNHAASAEGFGYWWHLNQNIILVLKMYNTKAV